MVIYAKFYFAYKCVGGQYKDHCKKDKRILSLNDNKTQQFYTQIFCWIHKPK